MFIEFTFKYRFLILLIFPIFKQIESVIKSIYTEKDNNILFLLIIYKTSKLLFLLFLSLLLILILLFFIL